MSARRFLRAVQRITTSARSSSDCGTMIPSALAVFRLMLSSNHVGLLYRNIRRFRAAQNLVDDGGQALARFFRIGLEGE
jgi:hypothetical protein